MYKYIKETDSYITETNPLWDSINVEPIAEIPVEEMPLSEQASTMSMTKAEFLILVTGLTKNMRSPVTLEAIETLLASDSDIRMRFTYANTVERNHPMLDGVSQSFGVTPEMLDIMFVNKDQLIYLIDNNLPIPTEL